MTDEKDYALLADIEGALDSDGDNWRRKLWREVADRLTALRAERDEARMMYEGASSADQQHIQEAADRIRKAEAERDALLKAIGNAQYSLSGYAPPEFNSAAAILMNAVAALKAQQPAPGRTPGAR